MTNRIIIACICTIFISELMTYCQTPVIMVKPDDGSDRWGFANLKGEIIIPTIYETCFPFSEDGVAMFYTSKSKKYYFLNIQGDTLNVELDKFLVVEYFGFGIQGFHDGLVVVRVDDMYGCLNTQGKLAIPLHYDWISQFNGGHAIAEKEGRYYILDTQGKETLIEQKDIVKIKAFSQNRAAFKSSFGFMGYVDIQGKVVIPDNYISVGDFNCGLAWARGDDNYLGYIDTLGKWAIITQFVATRDFDAVSGLAMVKTDEGWTYADTTGKVHNFNISEIYKDFSEGLCMGETNEKIGFYNNKGEWIIEPAFDGARNFKNGYAAVRVEKKWGIIDKQGNWTILPKFEKVRDVEMVK